MAKRKSSLMTYLRSFSDHWHIRSMSFESDSSMVVLSSAQRTRLAPCSIFSLLMVFPFRAAGSAQCRTDCDPQVDGSQFNLKSGAGATSVSGSPVGRGRSRPRTDPVLVCGGCHPL